MADSTPALAPHRLSRQDFALYRGYLDGVALEQLHATYGTHTDLRHTRAHLESLRDTLSRAARRAQDPAAARLLRVKPGSLADSSGVTGSTRDSTQAAPNLDDYRERIDPDGFYSEAELLELYEADYPQSVARLGERRLARHRRLRERQAAALARLEATLAELPSTEHALDTWLEPALSRRLNAAGLVTLGDLLGLIVRLGHRWHTRVARVGPQAATRINTWLSTHGRSLRHELSALALTPRRQLPQGHSALSRPATTGVVPLEWLQVPDAIDGSAGENRFRAPLESCEVSTDFAAIQSWLEARGENPHTARAYRREAERILLWAILAKGKAFSSLSVSDATEYLEGFLKNPQPAERWVGRGRVERFNPEWRPFDAPLSDRSRESARKILHTMCRWLVERRYLATNPFSGVAGTPVDPKIDTSGRTLTHAQWAYVLRSATRVRYSLRERRDHCALLLAYATGLRRAELASATTSDLSRAVVRGRVSEGSWELRVVGNRGVTRAIPIPDAALAALQDYFDARALPRDFLACPPGTPLLMPARGAAGISAHGLGYAFKQIFERAAKQLSATNLGGARALRVASTHWLRHSYANHALDSGSEVRAVSEVLGHASLSTTRIYVKSARVRRHSPTNG